MHEEKILFSLSHLPDILARRAWLPHIFLKRRKMSEGAVGRDLSCKLRRAAGGNGRVYKNPGHRQQQQRLYGRG